MKSGTGQSGFASVRGLSTKPVVCRRSSPDCDFSIRQGWIAASEKVAGRPRRPLGAASYSIPGSNQIRREPRCRRASWSCGGSERQACSCPAPNLFSLRERSHGIRAAESGLLTHNYYEKRRARSLTELARATNVALEQFVGQKLPVRIAYQAKT